ncbi:MAG: hypothetical protein NUV91_08170 [Candidatus Omnitrophica bacterium]|nr:hypothetical protein [Candidatus Omnitrophota bacterium]
MRKISEDFIALTIFIAVLAGSFLYLKGSDRIYLWLEQSAIGEFVQIFYDLYNKENSVAIYEELTDSRLRNQLSQERYSRRITEDLQEWGKVNHFYLIANTLKIEGREFFFTSLYETQREGLKFFEEFFLHKVKGGHWRLEDYKIYTTPQKEEVRITQGGVAVKKPLRNGEIKEYYPGGDLKLEGNYVNGLKEGIFQEYHENGNLASVGTYQKGKPTGCFTLYDQSGKIKAKHCYQEGKEKPIVIDYWGQSSKSLPFP